MPRKRRVDGDDDDRLPEGMRRVAYDADTQTYTYESVNGAEYTGQAGQRHSDANNANPTTSKYPPSSSRKDRRGREGREEDGEEEGEEEEEGDVGGGKEGKF
ncbi:hypothetical protein N658DRAFT_488852 [Parathielavia hyrcaniae]|uniref:Uncharacterized protein n=1 Tax=Parathielavia hyrcaniae TaxID=113614 RepID=A0AAN6PYT7_9PEZI|nr:hypothetical protein N658DRAFT_488852 [Parathielavia hyrcaniae]